MRLTPVQRAHVAKFFPECRTEMAAYLAAAAEVVVQPQSEVSEAGEFAITVLHNVLDRLLRHG